MTTLVLDAGALIALDRNDRTVWAMLRVAAVDATEVSVPAGAIAQAWRDGARQALLARALKHCDEVPLDGALARASGVLCGHADTADVSALPRHHHLDHGQAHCLARPLPLQLTAYPLKF